MNYTIDIMLKDGYYEYELNDQNEALVVSQLTILNPIVIQDFEGIKIF